MQALKYTLFALMLTLAAAGCKAHHDLDTDGHLTAHLPAIR